MTAWEGRAPSEGRGGLLVGKGGSCLGPPGDGGGGGGGGASLGQGKGMMDINN